MPLQPTLHSLAAVGAVIDAEGRFLVIQRADNGRWEPPAGRVEDGESPWDAVVREVHEETAVKVQPVRLASVQVNVVHPLRPVTLTFLCKPVSGEAQPDGVESVAVAWLTADEVRERLPEAHAARLLDALSPDVTCRVHDGTTVLASHEVPVS